MLQIFEDFSKIKTTELFGQPWAKSSLHHLCPNVLNMIDKFVTPVFELLSFSILKRFNRISRWIPTTVLREQNPKNRVKMLNKHVLIAQVNTPMLVRPLDSFLQHLKDLANYHILQAYVSGLNHSSLSRMKRLWSKLPKRSTQVPLICRALLSSLSVDAL